tara:strand:+ start:1399 stop:1521 length:123 start_codon:yes stop_codon:yes gene_type:complete
LKFNSHAIDIDSIVVPHSDTRKHPESVDKSPLGGKCFGLA